VRERGQIRGEVLVWEKPQKKKKGSGEGILSGYVRVTPSYWVPKSMEGGMWGGKGVMEQMGIPLRNAPVGGRFQRRRF